ncbi:MAG TPA: phosphatase PAP2 family protein [Ilumatobacteraceae bacterium]|nr:phosphatase PAP2 family protein [Ilumatobacteraceae bacterium]
MATFTPHSVTGWRAAVDAFDEWADQALERVRGNRTADAAFSLASHLGDFSVLWHIVGTARGLTSDRRANQAIALSVVLGVESLVVNQGVKRLFRRARPTEAGDERFPVRKPSTSSFPSGHASSAFTAAAVLTSWGGARTAPFWFGLAAVVGVSRAYVRIHHASDIVGAVVGLAVGIAAARLLRRCRSLAA